MALVDQPRGLPTDFDRAYTSATSAPDSPDDACVPTRTDWPQDDFLAWLDGEKKRLGLRSDYQLAQYLGLGHTLISGWRNGRQRPSIPTLNQIAAVLEEDARRLWVLAGQANAVDVGLGDEDARPRTAPDFPDGFQDLLDAYDKLETNEDRVAVSRYIRLLTHGILADLAARKKNPTSRRRTG